ncbi:hypothetical protein [Frigoribacterium sp. CG_9.8]|uniref:hypothetical protein n=1 Tax=Frigoribacterium sp. CG_9.8 TaxID=2787733 RepID=UPI0018C9F340|nr:hypothetical protein [Frigoribacterium sp. CG_9.8]MBG6106598.1 hypothetical protein [Frigoribacterium sp. CG_9.8]
MKKFIKTHKATLIGATAALLVGVGIGGAGGGTPAPAVAEAQTKTVTVTNEVTPPVCADALDSAERLMGLASEGFQLSSEAITLISRFDFDGANAKSAEMGAMVGQIGAERANFDGLDAECRASGGDGA